MVEYTISVEDYEQLYICNEWNCGAESRVCLKTIKLTQEREVIA